jgi:nicotinate-nucleotide adenylyltransferase
MTERINPRGDRRGGRIGLLGGSFNPAHAGHRSIAELARRRLRLDAVWLLVSPGNPLKPAAGMAPFAARLESARRIADGRRIVASGIEAALGTRYTADTLRGLRRRFPRARFVWVMGADLLEQLPRWRRWRAIAGAIPFAVFPRPTYNHRALASLAARRLASARRPERVASALAGMAPPAWVFLTAPQHAASGSAIRAARPEARVGSTTSSASSLPDPLSPPPSRLAPPANP